MLLTVAGRTFNLSYFHTAGGKVGIWLLAARTGQGFSNCSSLRIAGHKQCLTGPAVCRSQQLDLVGALALYGSQS